MKFYYLILLTFALTGQVVISAELDGDLAKLSKNAQPELTQGLDPFTFTDVDISFLKQFSLSNLPPAPDSVSNQYADNVAVAKLGKQLFFDKRLSDNGEVSCATCHQPEKYFTDGLAQSKAIGTTLRSAPSILGSPHSAWQFWDGRKDSLWSQALAPIEDIHEHGLTRTEFVRKFIRIYKQDYQALFGDPPSRKQLRKISRSASPLGDGLQQKSWRKLSKSSRQMVNRVFSNAGKALMAYQRQLKLPAAKFDHFISHLANKNFEKLPEIFSSAEVNGLRLFVGKANCASCHNGPLLTNFEFHNVGAPETDIKQVDMGRYEGVKTLVADEFTCLSEWSDAPLHQCEEMRFLKKTGPELVGAFKTPTLRNIAMTAPYMQKGQFNSLEDVIAHYNVPTPPIYDPEQHPNRPHFDILPLQLTPDEIAELVSFLKTLTSPLDQADSWWFDEQRK